MQERYEKAMRTIRSAVSYMAAAGALKESFQELRVGVNSTMFHQDAVTKLMIAKGLITAEEYELALVEAAEAEAQARADQAREVCQLPAHFDFV